MAEPTAINVNDIKTTSYTFKKGEAYTLEFENDIAGQVEFVNTSGADAKIVVYKTKANPEYEAYKYEKTTVDAIKVSQTVVKHVVTLTDQQYKLDGENTTAEALEELGYVVGDNYVITTTAEKYNGSSYTGDYEIEGVTGEVVQKNPTEVPTAAADYYKTATTKAFWNGSAYAADSVTTLADANSSEAAIAAMTVEKPYLLYTNGVAGEAQADAFTNEELLEADNGEDAIIFDTKNDNRQILKTITLKGVGTADLAGTTIGFSNASGTVANILAGDFYAAKGAKNTYKGYNLNDIAVGEGTNDTFNLGKGDDTIIINALDYINNKAQKFGTDTVVATAGENLKIDFSNPENTTDKVYEISAKIDGKDVVLTDTETATRHYSYIKEVVTTEEQRQYQDSYQRVTVQEGREITTKTTYTVADDAETAGDNEGKYAVTKTLTAKDGTTKFEEVVGYVASNTDGWRGTDYLDDTTFTATYRQLKGSDDEYGELIEVDVQTDEDGADEKLYAVTTTDTKTNVNAQTWTAGQSVWAESDDHVDMAVTYKQGYKVYNTGTKAYGDTIYTVGAENEESYHKAGVEYLYHVDTYNKSDDYTAHTSSGTKVSTTAVKDGETFYETAKVDGVEVLKTSLGTEIKDDYVYKTTDTVDTVLGAVKIQGYGASNVIGDGSIQYKVNGGSYTDVLSQVSSAVEGVENKKTKDYTFTGNWLNNTAVSTEKNDTFTLGTGSDVITFKGKFGNDTVNITPNETLQLNFQTIGGTALDSDYIQYTASGNNVTASVDVKYVAYATLNGKFDGVTVDNKEFAFELQEYFVKKPVNNTQQLLLDSKTMMFRSVEAYDKKNDTHLYLDNTDFANTLVDGKLNTTYGEEGTVSDIRVYKVVNGQIVGEAVTADYINAVKALDIQVSTGAMGYYNKQASGTVTLVGLNGKDKNATVYINGSTANDDIYKQNNFETLFTFNEADVKKGKITTKALDDDIDLTNYVSSNGKGVVVNSGTGTDTIVGSYFNDTVKGGAGYKTITELGGTNKITLAKDGSNITLGGFSSNTVTAKAGVNTIGVDTIGVNKINLGTGADVVTIAQTSASGINIIKAGNGENELYVKGISNNTFIGGKDVDTIDIDAGLNVIKAGKGDDVVTLSGGYNNIDLGAGDDRIVFDAAVNDELTAIVAGAAGDDTYDAQDLKLNNKHKVVINDAKGANTLVLDGNKADAQDKYDVYFNVSLNKKGKGVAGKTFLFSEDAQAGNINSKAGIQFTGSVNDVKFDDGTVSFAANVKELTSTVASWLSANGYKSSDAVFDSGNATAIAQLSNIYKGNDYYNLNATKTATIEPAQAAANVFSVGA